MKKLVIFILLLSSFCQADIRKAWFVLPVKHIIDSLGSRGTAPDCKGIKIFDCAVEYRGANSYLCLISGKVVL
jgi:hypothetical protein